MISEGSEMFQNICEALFQVSIPECDLKSKRFSPPADPQGHIVERSTEISQPSLTSSAGGAKKFV